MGIALFATREQSGMGKDVYQSAIQTKSGLDSNVLALRLLFELSQPVFCARFIQLQIRLKQSVSVIKGISGIIGNLFVFNLIVQSIHNRKAMKLE